MLTRKEINGWTFDELLSKMRSTKLFIHEYPTKKAEAEAEFELMLDAYFLKSRYLGEHNGYSQ